MAIMGLILAGGAARRMGGADKALLSLAGRPLVAHVAAGLAPQVARFALSANGMPERFAALLPGVPVLADPREAQGLGPLAGVLAGLDWAAAQGAEALVTVAVDTPFLPSDLVARLQAAASAGGGAACASSLGRMHYTCALRPVAGAAAALRAALATGTRRLRFGLDAAVEVPFGLIGAGIGAGASQAAADPFGNLNTPEDLAAAEAMIAVLAPPAPGAAG
ncbi:molybdenum cofactor guanylyltransferase MobA [Phaeovulum sp. W22_SRMD_FR3]